MELMFMGKTGELVMCDVDHVTREEEDRYLDLADPPVRSRVARQLVQLRVAERLLCATATPAQRAIGWSGHVAVDLGRLREFSARRFPQSAAMPLPPGIYGELIPYQQVAEREQAVAARSGGRELEAAGIVFCAPPPARALALLESAHAAGWRYGRWYSQTDPDGDLGCHHVAHLIPVSRRQFLAARRDGWPAWGQR